MAETPQTRKYRPGYDPDPEGLKAEFRAIGEPVLGLPDGSLYGPAGPVCPSYAEAFDMGRAILEAGNWSSFTVEKRWVKA